MLESFRSFSPPPFRRSRVAKNTSRSFQTLKSTRNFVYPKNTRNFHLNTSVKVPRSLLQKNTSKVFLDFLANLRVNPIKYSPSQLNTASRFFKKMSNRGRKVLKTEHPTLTNKAESLKNFALRNRGAVKM